MRTLILLVLLAACFTGCQRAQGTTATPTTDEVVAARPQQAKATATPKVYYYCNAVTKKGTPCRHVVKAEGLRCFQHQGQPPAPGYK